MPRTKFQSIVFSSICVFCMVFCMTVYSIALKQGGLTLRIFQTAIKDMWLEYVIVFCLIFFVISPTALKLAHRIINPSQFPPIFFILAVQCFTICLIEPTITLIATLIHGGIDNWFCAWISQAVICFPMAFFLQIFFVGPFVRFVFRVIFSKIPALYCMKTETSLS